MTEPDKIIKWTVPWKWHFQKMKKELRGVFTLSTFAGIILVSLILIVVLRHWVEKKFGPIEFNWVYAGVVSILAGFVFMLIGLLTCCIPSTVRISAKGIFIFSTNQGVLFRYKNITDVIIYDSQIPRFTFRIGNRAHEYAVAPSVSLDELRRELERHMGVPVKIEKESDGQTSGADA